MSSSFHLAHDLPTVSSDAQFGQKFQNTDFGSYTERSDCIIDRFIFCTLFCFRYGLKIWKNS